MENKNQEQPTLKLGNPLPFKKIIMVSGIIFIAGYAVVATALGATGMNERPQVDLSGLHEQIMSIESSLSEKLLQQAKINTEVEDLRDQRSDVQKIIDDAIHKQEKDFHDLMIIKSAEEEGKIEPQGF